MARNHEHLHQHGALRRRKAKQAEAAPLVERDSNDGNHVSVVYVTAAKTFDGPVAGYTTLKPNAGGPEKASSTPDNNKNSPAVQAKATQTPSKPKPKPSPETSATSRKEQPTRSPSPKKSEETSRTKHEASTKSDHSSIPRSIAAPKTSVDSNAPLRTAAPTSSESMPSQATALSSPSASPSAAPSSSTGMSSGAKAGVAIGVIGGLILVTALVFLVIRRRAKKQNESYGKTEDEKSGAAFAAGRGASMRSTRTASTAPRLSLRPVTQFSPVLDANRKSAGDLLAVTGGAAAGGAPRHLTPSPQNAGGPRDRPAPQSQMNDPTNPFGNHAEQARGPMGAPNNASSASLPMSQNMAGEAAAGFVAGGMAGGMAAQRGNAPRPLELSRNESNGSVSPPRGPPSPARSETSFMTATSAGPSVAPMMGAPGPGTSPVHRIQLDFKPSMEDELELRAGALVRLLHEYDDGWALCTRLDRSQKGVCPRTCLSTRPVKPRPGPGPHGPPPRGAGPFPPNSNPNMRLPIQHNRPMGPPGVRPPRPLSPANGRHSPGPRSGPPGRPMTPQGHGRSQSPGPGAYRPGPGPRSQSPGPYGPGNARRPMAPPSGRPRSASAGSLAAANRAGPPGPSRMNPNSNMGPYDPMNRGSPRNSPPMMQGAPSPAPSGGLPSRKPVPGQAL